MIYLRLVLGVLLIGGWLACVTRMEVATTPTAVMPTHVIQLVIIDEKGWPINGVAVFDEDGGVYVAEYGGLELTVTGPVALIAYKPGYGPSRREVFAPGHHELTLYAIGRVN